MWLHPLHLRYAKNHWQAQCWCWGWYVSNTLYEKIGLVLQKQFAFLSVWCCHTRVLWCWMIWDITGNYVKSPSCENGSRGRERHISVSVCVCVTVWRIPAEPFLFVVPLQIQRENLQGDCEDCPHIRPSVKLLPENLLKTGMLSKFVQFIAGHWCVPRKLLHAHKNQIQWVQCMPGCVCIPKALFGMNLSSPAGWQVP